MSKMSLSADQIRAAYSYAHRIDRLMQVEVEPGEYYADSLMVPVPASMIRQHLEQELAAALEGLAKLGIELTDKRFTRPGRDGVFL